VNSPVTPAAGSSAAAPASVRTAEAPSVRPSETVAERLGSPVLPYTAVLFDCDGVLVDSESITQSVLRDMLEELGWSLTREECIRLFVGKALKDEWEVILRHTGVRIDDAWLAAFRERRNAALRTDLSPVPGIESALEAVRAAYGDRIAVGTGADRGKCELQLGLTGLDRYFSGRVFSGMEMPRSKPAPDVYLAAARALGIDPAGAAVIEDSAAGVRAGAAAGARVLGFSRGDVASTPAAELLAAGASEVFADMRELPALLGA
jgi:HAD superfamily hydrolase (TIGR01509 family)